MDTTITNAVLWSKTNVCCCCLKDGCSKDISLEYYYSGHKEVYKNMLKETLNVNIIYLEKACISICEVCIIRLRDATSFKQMVSQNERRFIEHLEKIQYDIDKGSKSSVSDVKFEQIKSESNVDMDFVDDNSYDDDEILSNLKLELTPSEAAILDSSIQKKLNGRKVKLKKCKIKSKEDNFKKDWSQIIERRGSGPILRENSLKLLANSTICVFQWNRSRYTCFCCQQPFSDMNELKNHTLTAHTLKNIEKKIISQQNRLVKVEISKLNCQICDVSLTDLSDLRQHLTDEHNIAFASPQHLLVPFKIEKELVCQLCAEKFNVFRLLNIHMNRHFQNQVCHICGAGFSNLVFLNLHKSRSHRPQNCKHCEASFKNKSERKTHEINVHNIKFERKLRFPCPYCSERFFQENFRVLHLVEKHGFERPQFKCGVCNKVFITKSLCNNHLKNVHLKEKTHECDICHNFFYTKSDVSRHKVTHTGEKNFSCSICNNPFASKDSLRRHMKRTHGGVH